MDAIRKMEASLDNAGYSSVYLQVYSTQSYSVTDGNTFLARHILAAVHRTGLPHLISICCGK